jgi:hypothetical protein
MENTTFKKMDEELDSYLSKIIHSSKENQEIEMLISPVIESDLLPL